MGHPLEGVRVLDLSQFQAGPSCTQLLAWLGAEVIKIEQPGVGDPTRAGVPAFRTTEESLRPGLDSFFYLVFNSNKRSLCLDLKSEDGDLHIHEAGRHLRRRGRELCPGPDGAFRTGL